MASLFYNLHILLLSLFWCSFLHHSAASSPVLSSNQLVGVKYISYDNLDGTLATGDCCDQPGKTAGSCSPNMCDTSFTICATNDPKAPCNLIMPQYTPPMYNTNIFQFGRYIGNGVNKTTSFFVIKFPFNKSNINVTMMAVEQPDVGLTGGPKDIAEFHFVVNWMDPIFLNPPNFRRFILKDTRAKLIVDVVSQCSKYYYTQNCSVYCKPDRLHYICLSNGAIQCLPGWLGPKCLTTINHCPGNKCQHGSTCKPVLLNYTCVCTPQYTGHYCQTKILTPVPSSTVLPVRNNNSATNGKRPHGTNDKGFDLGLAAKASVVVLLLILVVCATVMICDLISRGKRPQVSPVIPIHK